MRRLLVLFLSLFSISAVAQQHLPCNPGGTQQPLHTGGSVKQPQIYFSVEPEYTEEARRKKLSGNVEVYLRVDENGIPSHVRVVKGIGLGLDEKAVEAVQQYRFKPATKDGVPVTVEIHIEVNFQIF